MSTLSAIRQRGLRVSFTTHGLVVVAAVGAAIVAVALLRGGSPTPADVIRAETSPPPRVPLMAYARRDPSRPLDLNDVVYVARLDGSHSQRLGAGDVPIVSPDGTQVAFTRRDSRLATSLLVASVGGAAQRRFSAAPGRPVFLVGWLSGGRLLIALDDGIRSVNPDGSVERLLPRLGVSDEWSISPAGDAIAFTV